jgi:hypothetical protein
MGCGSEKSLNISSGKSQKKNYKYIVQKTSKSSTSLSLEWQPGETVCAIF